MFLFENLFLTGGNLKSYLFGHKVIKILVQKQLVNNTLITNIKPKKNISNSVTNTL